MRRRLFGDLWEDLFRMQSEMDDVISGHFPEYSHNFNFPLLEAPNTKELMNWRKPLTDIYETEKEVISKVELPGLDKKDIKINLTENSLEIKAEKKKDSQTERNGFNRIERSYIGFYKCLSLPSKIDVDNVKTSFDNGVLELTMPKKEPGKNKVKHIELK